MIIHKLLTEGKDNSLKDEKIRTPSNEFPASTIKMLSKMYLEESCIKYRTIVVNGGCEIPNVPKGTASSCYLLNPIFFHKIFCNFRFEWSRTYTIYSNIVCS